MTYAFTMIESPVGPLTLIASDAGLAAVQWANDDPRRVRLAPLVDDAHHPILRETARQLGDYFAGRRTVFELPLDARGTPFQKKVWDMLVRIPFGETRTYGELARELGNPNAMRAVGAANGKNPIAIVAPCHRVIGAAGELTGFAGGLAAKVTLLSIEGKRFAEGATAKSRSLDAGPRRTRRPDRPDLFAR